MKDFIDMRQVSTNQRGQSPQLPQERETNKGSGRERSGWRHPWIGSLFCLPLVGLALLGAVLGQRLLPNFYFFDAPMFLAVMVIALVWGARPALFAVVLNTLILDYYFIPPLGKFDLHTWEGLLQLLPFVLSGVLIALITSQREAARRRAYLSEEEVKAYADELEQANAKLEQMNQLKDRFLSLASHELKTPITTIRAYAQLSLRRLAKQSERLSDTETLRSTLEKMVMQTGCLSTLVDDLLDINHIRAGKMELRLVPCDLREVCRAAVEDQRLLTGRPIELAVPTAPVILQADPDRMGQVVINLVSNAVKYSPEDCPVQVYVSQHDKEAVIQVSDAGSGIPLDQRTRIFEEFYRTPAAQGSSKRGLGLGLAICKEIVERHGGRIWCDSHEGNGSTFVVELPRCPSC
jgi:signal transduction histidine kinase